tara:strand:- start:25 stop:399 length:375 start_codon:yes stop_codon:yes gene_type:complete
MNRLAIAVVCVVLLTNCSDPNIRCENQEEAYLIAELYFAGRQDKLPHMGGLVAGYSSKDTQVTYLGECTHKVQSVVTENNKNLRPIFMTFEAVVVNDYGSENWKLKFLEVKDSNGKVLITEKNE